jgi:hypothetical protein
VYVEELTEMDERTPAEDDVMVEAALLQLLLALHPAQVTFPELLRMMAMDETDFVQRDTVEQAVGELVGDGLAHRNGEVIFASRAAVRCDELLFRQ